MTMPKLLLVVELLGETRNVNFRVGADHRGRRLQKTGRMLVVELVPAMGLPFGRLEARRDLLLVGPEVDRGVEDFSGTRHGAEQFQITPREGQPPAVRGARLLRRVDVDHGARAIERGPRARERAVAGGQKVDHCAGQRRVGGSHIPPEPGQRAAHREIAWAMPMRAVHRSRASSSLPPGSPHDSGVAAMKSNAVYVFVRGGNSSARMKF